MNKNLLKYLREYVSENIVLRVMRQANGKPEWVKVKDYPVEWSTFLMIKDSNKLSVFGGNYKTILLDKAKNKIIYESPEKKLKKDDCLEILKKVPFWERWFSWI
jgi:hypothetical protein